MRRYAHASWQITFQGRGTIQCRRPTNREGSGPVDGNDRARRGSGLLCTTVCSGCMYLVGKCQPAIIHSPEACREPCASRLGAPSHQIRLSRLRVGDGGPYTIRILRTESAVAIHLLTHRMCLRHKRLLCIALEVTLEEKNSRAARDIKSRTEHDAGSTLVRTKHSVPIL